MKDDMTLRALQALGPYGKKTVINALARSADRVLDEYDINTPLRLSHFWAQVSHECSGFRSLEESLNYTPDRLMRLFGRRRISPSDAQKYGRTADRPANEEALANILYGGAWGRKNLGNTEPGDGWRFRGRGPKQITGRDNYKRYGKAIGVDLISDPEKAANPTIGLRLACEFWKANGLNKLADKNDIKAITKKINGGYNGLADRKANFVIAWRIFGNGDPRPQSGRSLLTDSTETRAIGASAAGGGVGVMGAYELGREGVEHAVDLKDTVDTAKEAFSLTMLEVTLICAVALMAGGLAYLLWNRYVRAREAD